jgi:HPt (histidine-containing phosphotransfer) domain-containing protein
MAGEKVATIESLKSMYFGDTEIIAETITVFLSTIPDLVADFKKSFAGPDPKNIQHSIHALKGAVLIFGDTSLCEHLKKMDRGCKEGRLAEVKADYVNIVDETNAFCKVLEGIKRQCERAA